ncbi:MAG TPA: FCD domain-containing protein [Pseudonocardiaceae bacterium]|nr:FCD domain-containing protein [Pseudonocardiaceae bacterium]
MRSGQFSGGQLTGGGSSAAKRRFVMVAQRLLESIQSGQYKPGDRLPPDRTMAADFEISRATVREALLALELLGVVEIRHGSGVYVVDASVRSELADKDWITPSTTALFEARTAVEPKIARLCALRMSKAEIKGLSDSVTTARRVVKGKGEYIAFTEIQIDFHMRLVDGCGNPILADINRHLMSVEEHPLWALLNQQALRTQAQRLDQVTEHAKILKHIKDHEPEAAAAAMLAHLTDLGRTLVGGSWVS